MKINGLNEFNNKHTFVFLYDRVIHLQSLINEIENLINLNVDTINSLERGGVSFSVLQSSLYTTFYVMYRSLFQKAQWEDDIRGEIAPEAYSPTLADEFLTLHDKIVKTVDKVYAHQDHENPYRLVYEDRINIEDSEYWSLINIQPVHPRSMRPYLETFESSLQTIYRDKFGEDLNVYPSF